MSALREAFLDELKDLLDAELQLLKALPKMAAAAQNDGLRAAFQEHQQQTAGQIKRLSQVFASFEEPMRGKKCKGMEGLLKEGEDILKEDSDANVKDAALIAAAQKVEHYEMAGYGTARTFAFQLDYDDMAKTLQQTLDEEGKADEKLTELAESSINVKADK